MRCTLAVLALCALLARGARGQAFWLPRAVVVTLPESVRTAVALLHMAQPDLVITGPVASAPPTASSDFADFLLPQASDFAACWSAGPVKLSLLPRHQTLLPAGRRGPRPDKARRARAENCVVRSLDLLDSCTVFLQALQARHRQHDGTAC